MERRRERFGGLGGGEEGRKGISGGLGKRERRIVKGGRRKLVDGGGIRGWGWGGNE